MSVFIRYHGKKNPERTKTDLGAEDPCLDKNDQNLVNRLKKSKRDGRILDDILKHTASTPDMLTLSKQHQSVVKEKSGGRAIETLLLDLVQGAQKLVNQAGDRIPTNAREALDKAVKELSKLALPATPAGGHDSSTVTMELAT
ncbi:hypothetical protein N657DRAFT_677675 [Parathielavia appendiculata]|uniref:Uncharacterized protein n=1 Tax=Parathielavia appendiculata TaxID=2587402 RepID=A0AAN6U6W0_9PEZI|nr:hypothetical protein N657DRAFT_677675 [Parathielavia appendiculata]